jgi:hypothetical protein
MATHMRAELVSDAVALAHRRGLIPPGRDRPLRPRQSIRIEELPCHAGPTRHAAVDGRTGSCFDNAVAESLFASLKAEIGTRVFADRTEARREVFTYITYYNNKRTGRPCGFHALPGRGCRFRGPNSSTQTTRPPAGGWP